MTLLSRVWLPHQWWLTTATDPRGGGYRIWQKSYWYTFDTSKATPLKQLQHSFIWFLLGIAASPLVSSLVQRLSSK